MASLRPAPAAAIASAPARSRSCWSREGRVAIDFEPGECTFCSACATACPEPVFAAPRVMQHVAAISDACLARRGVTCMSCRDACPEDAIRLRPAPAARSCRSGRGAACTGCGACIAPCPSDAIAIAARPREPAHA
jgi:ferredoxin-type protein NapF